MALLYIKCICLYLDQVCLFARKMGSSTIHSVMSYLQPLELCGGIKKTLWELSQLVTTENPVKERPQITVRAHRV